MDHLTFLDGYASLQAGAAYRHGWVGVLHGMVVGSVGGAEVALLPLPLVGVPVSPLVVIVATIALV